MTTQFERGDIVEYDDGSIYVLMGSTATCNGSVPVGTIVESSGRHWETVNPGHIKKKIGHVEDSENG